MSDETQTESGEGLSTLSDEEIETRDLAPGASAEAVDDSDDAGDDSGDDAGDDSGDDAGDDSGDDGGDDSGDDSDV